MDSPLRFCRLNRRTAPCRIPGAFLLAPLVARLSAPQGAIERQPAESKGPFFGANIRNKFHCERVKNRATSAK